MRLAGKGNLWGRHKWVLAVLLVLPLLAAAGKWTALPTSGWLMRVLSLAGLSAHNKSRVEYVLFVPFAATWVVFFRLFLGIRLLGPFRSILLALAFQITGIFLGLAFLVIVIAVVVGIRPLVKAIRLPYFARVSVILSVVALIILLAILAGVWWGRESLARMAYFPIVVLCLTSDGFAKTLDREGLRSALWRGGMTALVAVLIALPYGSKGFRDVFLRFPELLIFEIGCIIAIAEYLDLRLLTGWNPPAARRGRLARRGSVVRSVGGEAAPRAAFGERQGVEVAASKRGGGDGGGREGHADGGEVRR